jgi:hypothetical protein
MPRRLAAWLQLKDFVRPDLVLSDGCKLLPSGGVEFQQALFPYGHQNLFPPYTSSCWALCYAKASHL